MMPLRIDGDAGAQTRLATTSRCSRAGGMSQEKARKALNLRPRAVGASESSRVKMAEAFVPGKVDDVETALWAA